MAAYIDACEQAHQLGVDFTMASTHTGVSVPPSEASERLVSSMEALLKVFFTNKPAPVNRHSQAALKDHLQSLERLSLGFYNRACHIGNHAFIEFAGLLNEWIAMARQTLDAACDPFSGLVWRAHNLNYVIEKLDCITAAYAPDHAHHQAVRIRESITPAVCGVTT